MKILPLARAVAIALVVATLAFFAVASVITLLYEPKEAAAPVLHGSPRTLTREVASEKDSDDAWKRLPPAERARIVLIRHLSEQHALGQEAVEGIASRISSRLHEQGVTCTEMDAVCALDGISGMTDKSLNLERCADKYVSLRIAGMTDSSAIQAVREGLGLK